MAIQLNPYLNFRDTARQALEFYQSVFGGELTLTTFAEMSVGVDVSAAEGDKIMHGQLVAPHGIVLMAADTPNYMEYTEGGNGTVSLSGDDELTLRGYWDALSSSGTVGVPLEKAPWGDTFGMCSDRVGVRWLVNIAAETTD
jgi:PhnB protein